MTVRDYYEVLDVPVNASLEDIRRQYKLLSLRWHPDKNLDNPEEALANFKELQHAYSVLSDPHERSWYDNHKSAILRGVDPSTETSAPEDELDLWPYFTPSAYSSHNDDDERGFYNVYSKVFSLIIDEEGDPSMKDAPHFGDSNTPYPEVKMFYSYWTSFITKRKFGYRAKWKVSDDDPKEVRRAMEKENKSEVAKAKKEYTQLVRNLTVFVKKRDKRILRALQEKKEKEAEEKQAALLAQKEREKKFREEIIQFQAKRMQELEEDEDHKEAEAAMQQLWESNNKNRKQRKRYTVKDDDDEEEEIEYYCEACKKSFKSEKKAQEHERSKKHIQAFKIYAEKNGLLKEEEEPQVEEVEELQNQEGEYDEVNIEDIMDGVDVHELDADSVDDSDKDDDGSPTTKQETNVQSDKSESEEEKPKWKNNKKKQKAISQSCP
eukprot:NODE_1381_length_1982_cov_48.223238_g1170_i0.p1 GENE.NODE_1381_length_1982_cov_48.223238_g1170_i0~~NODE_1381_length_1982_cov_48.223238_g1170_i0.p1  ORF type:complete len:456 (-),score=122.39 NODE_1381_length_1982_cov_48.223238_g1170_i0:613-1920(-)